MESIKNSDADILERHAKIHELCKRPNCAADLYAISKIIREFENFHGKPFRELNYIFPANLDVEITSHK